MNTQKEIDEFVPIYIAAITQKATEQQKIAYDKFMRGNINTGVFHMPEFMFKVNKILSGLTDG